MAIHVSRTKGALSLSKITEFVTVCHCQKNTETSVFRNDFQIITPVPWISKLIMEGYASHVLILKQC